jgi:hypothetical protein
MNAALGAVQAGMLEQFHCAQKGDCSSMSSEPSSSQSTEPFSTGDAENVFYSFPVVVKSGLRDVSVYIRKKGIQTREAFQIR